MEEKIKFYDTTGNDNELINNKSIYQKIDDYIKRHYYLRFNEIALTYEIAHRDNATYKTLNKSSLLISMVNSGIKVRNQALDIYLKSDYVIKYNPIKSYLKSLPDWDECDYITQFSSYVNTDNNELFAYHLKKWCVRAVLSVFYTEKINKHCIILANGEQHAGKSTYLNYLTPKELKPYSSENIGIDKDSRIKLCKVFIVNIEELEVMGKYDVNALKAILSTTWVNERLP